MDEYHSLMDLLRDDENGEPSRIWGVAVCTESAASIGVLGKFLAAREGNAERAAEMFKASLKWRRDNDVDNAIAWKFPSCFHGHYRILGLDAEKRPVL